MAEPLSEIERAFARLSEAQERFASMSDRIAGLKARGASTELYDQLLRTLENSLHLMQAQVRRLTDHLTTYRCYFMSGEHIRGVKVLDAPDDADVVIKVGQFLKEHPEYPSIEIWEGKRLVARLTRNNGQ